MPGVNNKCNNYDVRSIKRREREQRLTRTASLSPELTDFRPISSSESVICRLLAGFCRDMIGSFCSFCFFLLEFDGGGLKIVFLKKLLITECDFNYYLNGYFNSFQLIVRCLCLRMTPTYLFPRLAQTVA